MPVRTQQRVQQLKPRAAGEHYNKQKYAQNNELLGSLMHIKTRLEDYLRLVTTTDPSDIPPPDEIRRIIRQPTKQIEHFERQGESSHESFYFSDNNKKFHSAHSGMTSPVPQTIFLQPAEQPLLQPAQLIKTPGQPRSSSKERSGHKSQIGEQQQRQPLEAPQIFQRQRPQTALSNKKREQESFMETSD